MKSLFRRKSLDKILSESKEMNDVHGHGGLKKILTVRDLTFLGIAAVIGAGIFSTIGTAAFNGGPGVIFLFIVTAITCGFTAMCYAEFASRIPVSGSAYTYSYVSFGEIVAWIIGWALILEYAIGNIVVAISWSAYFNNILQAFGIHLPDWLTIGFLTAKESYEEALKAGTSTADLIYVNAPQIAGLKIIINLPAFVIVCLIAWLTIIGIKESKKTANLMVFIKLLILLLVAVIGIWYIFSEGTSDNWTPFLPNGVTGVLKGVSAVFFAYIGFDAISTTAEECANPQRDLPRGMIYSLVLCTVIYVIIALVITGMVNYKEFEGITDPLAYVFDKIDMKTVGFIISISAVFAATSVLLVFQIGQPRIWMSMSRDGLLPNKFGKIHRKYSTPVFSTIISGLLVAILVLFVDDGLMTDLTSIGTLFAFAVVSGGILILPSKKAEAGKFRVPYINGKWIVLTSYLIFIWLNKSRIENDLLNFSSDTYQNILFLIFIVLTGIMTYYTFKKNFSLIPVLGVIFCMYLMLEIPAKSWIVFFGWMTFGLIIYMIYGYRKSRLATNQ